MKFENLLMQAKAGNEVALSTLTNKYKPMLIKAAILNGAFDEDLYQELCITLIKCVEKFEF